LLVNDVTSTKKGYGIMTIKISREELLGREELLEDSDYFKAITPSKPLIYKRVAGYCAPEMYVDPKGLFLYEKDGSVWVRNSEVKVSNDSNANVIAVIPKSQVLSLYQADREGSGATEEYVKRGLRL
jgi:hypothetical protein